MIIVFTFIFIAVFILLMAIGVIMGRKPIQGSCGGKAGGVCNICGDDTNQCVSKK